MDKHWHSSTRQYLKKECEPMNNAQKKNSEKTHSRFIET